MAMLNIHCVTANSEKLTLAHAAQVMFIFICPSSPGEAKEHLKCTYLQLELAPDFW